MEKPEQEPRPNLWSVHLAPQLLAQQTEVKKKCICSVSSHPAFSVASLNVFTTQLVTQPASLVKGCSADSMATLYAHLHQTRGCGPGQELPREKSEWYRHGRVATANICLLQTNSTDWQIPKEFGENIYRNCHLLTLFQSH